MALETWLAFCATTIAVCFTPGPAVLFVVSVALARGTRAGLAAALGIVTTNTAYFALSATGIAAVIVASHELFVALRWAGAAYLVVLGVGMVLGRARPAVARSPAGVRRAFWRALVVQGANPHALLFFLALVPQFVDPRGSVVLQMLVLAASTLVIELGVLAVYVALGARARDVAGDRLAGALQRVGGAFLLAAGARLAVVR
jgi:homoserine/homoserine lactone efflux protein